MPVKKKNQECGKVQIRRLMYKNYQLTVKAPNNIVFLKDGIIMQITDIYSMSDTNDINKIYISGNKINIIDAALNYPCDSSILHMYKVTLNNNFEKVDSVLSNVNCKMVLLTIRELAEDIGESYVVPMLHTN